jgi:hypothetical protein
MTLTPGKPCKMTLTFHVLESVDLQSVKEFIIDALESTGGSRDPRDPLFNSLSRVRVTQVRPRAKLGAA